MSLSGFLKIKSNKQKFNKVFPRPKIKLKGKIKSEPISKSYSTVGIAVDYLIRFKLKYEFPKSISYPWISEMAIEDWKVEFIFYLNDAKKLYFNFLKSGRITRRLIQSTIDLAKIDTYYRTGRFYYPDSLGEYEEETVNDIRNILKNIDINNLRVKRRSILNPHFGYMSELIGGADADLIIDNKLIDIKTTKKLEISRDMLNQIIGYYFLGMQGKVKRVRKWTTITELGFYFSRYDLLYTIPIDSIIDRAKSELFLKWFTDKIKKYNKTEVQNNLELREKIEMDNSIFDKQ